MISKSLKGYIKPFFSPVYLYNAMFSNVLCYFSSLPGLSYSFFFKMTGEKIGLVTSQDQFRFMEDGIKGQVEFKFYISTLSHNITIYIGGMSFVDLREASVEIDEGSNEREFEGSNDDEIIYIDENNQVLTLSKIFI